MNKARLYFDNSSTSYPKPQEVIDMLGQFYRQPVGSYGRSMDRRTLYFSSNIEILREKIAEILGTILIENIVFTKNATEGSNLIIAGLSLENTTIAISPLEHNAIIRPLYALKDSKNLNIVTLPSDNNGIIDVEQLKQTDLTNCSLAIINLESNVNGVIQPIKDIASVLKAKSVDIMVDATQHIDAYTRLDIDKLGIDYLILTGHKKLMGSTGSGAMFIRHPEKVRPIFLGGNGYHSDSLDITLTMPSRYEVGTIDMLSLNALLSAIESTKEKTLDNKVWLQFIDRLQDLDSRVLYSGSGSNIYQGSCVSITLKKENEEYYKNNNKICIHCHKEGGQSLSEIATKLYHEYGIICRDGLQCSPFAHKFLGSMPEGGIRFSPNFFYHNEDDIDYLYKSIKNVLQKR